MNEIKIGIFAACKLTSPTLIKYYSYKHCTSMLILKVMALNNTVKACKKVK
jgi:hypothetical protein